MVHKPIAIMILPILVAGILMLGILAATARGEDNNTGGGETQAPPAGGGETQAPPASGGETQAPPAAAPPAAAPPTPTSGCGPGTDNSTCSATPTPGNATASQASSNNTILVKTILTVHNRERAAFDFPSLTWNDSLAAGSQIWADHIAETKQFLHCGEVPGCNTHYQGENIAWGGSSRKTYGELVAELQDAWVAEKSDYHGVGAPTIIGDPLYGHWAQMVSPKAKEVGCGTALDGHILVCRYSQICAVMIFNMCRAR